MNNSVNVNITTTVGPITNLAFANASTTVQNISLGTFMS